MGRKNKRIHPIDSNLIWCSKCQQYRQRYEFSKRGFWVEYKCKNCKSKENVKRRKYPNKIIDRKHPEKDNFFWCPRCQQYKEKSDFGFKKNKANQISEMCRDCKKEYEKQPEYKEKTKARMKEHKEKLTDTFIKQRLGSCIDKNTTVIELKRQEIIMRQTLKDFINWRKESGLIEPEPLKKPRSKLHPDDNNLAWCPSCEEYKPLEYFFKDCTNEHGITVYCKKCHGERKRIKKQRRLQNEPNYSNV